MDDEVDATRFVGAGTRPIWDMDGWMDLVRSWFVPVE